MGLSAAFVMAAMVSLAAQEPLAERPKAAGAGEVKANVLVVKGVVRVKAEAAAQPFEAKAGLPLLASDEIRVATGGFALLLLKNGYVVSVDEEITMPVGKIQKLGAGQAGASAETQLEQFAKGGDISEGEKTRAIGFQSRILAVSTAGGSARTQLAEGKVARDTQAKEKKSSEVVARPPAPKPSRPATPATPPPPAPAASMSDMDEMKKAAPREPVSVPPAKTTAARGGKGNAVTITWKPLRGGAATPVPEKVLAFLRSANCLEGLAKPVTIRAKVSGGAVERLRLVGDEPTPECLNAGKLAVDQGAAVPDGWMELTLSN